MNNANRGLTDLIQSQASLARSLSSATDEIIFSEVLCAVYPELREARQEYRQQAAVAMILNEFAQFVRELAEPPMMHNWQTQYILDQMGFVKISSTLYHYDACDFSVYLVPLDTEYDKAYKVDATKTSLRHFFRKFHTRIEQQIYDRLAIEAYGDEL